MKDAIDAILSQIRKQPATKDEDTPFMYRYRCLACHDSGVENYKDPAALENIYARPCKHCAAGQQRLASWRARKWRGNIDGKPIPNVYMYGTNAEIAQVMAYPCDHDPLPEKS